MKTKRTCKNCYWGDSCEFVNVCGKCNMYDPLDGSDIEAEYEADLHMREEEYQSYIDEMKGKCLMAFTT